MRTVGTGQDAERTTITANGLWRLRPDGVTPVDRAWPGPLTVLVPTEQVLVTVVTLPFASRRQRLDAAPFALEDLIAEPLDDVHVALGAETTPRRHVCAVVAHSLMRRWAAELHAAGMSHSVLLPDALLLPAPPAGAWTVSIEGDRALVRTGDGAGFAVEVATLPAAWDAGGRPRLIHQGGALPDEMRSGLDDLSIELAAAPAPAVFIPPVDLRQGAYAAAGSGSVSPWRWVGWAAAAGVVGHFALTAADTIVLHALADRREAETRTLISRTRPDLEATADLTSAVDQIAPAGGGQDGPFVRRWGRVARALTGQPLVYRTIAYAPDQAMSLSVTAPDAAALDAAVQTLGAAAVPASSALAPIDAGAGAPNGLNAVITLPAASSPR